MRGRDMLLVDDVMTSGATLAAAAEACLAAGAAVSVVVLARVAKDGVKAYSPGAKDCIAGCGKMTQSRSTPRRSAAIATPPSAC
jgi:phosphoribosylpyrophosphate synthetase